MPVFALKIVVGVVVGVVVGLTGMGGGVLLLPILIFGLRVPAIVAIGSDAAFNALTKIGAGVLHWRQGTVNWRLMAALSSGSLPGAFLGVSLLHHLQTIYGVRANDFLREFLGVLLVGVPVLMFLQSRMQRYLGGSKRPLHWSWIRMILIGLFCGFLVGSSSVGSGSIVMPLLLLFTTYAPGILVGTDIIHGFFLTGFTGLLQYHLGNVDSSLVFPLLIGSVPGSVLGARLSSWLPGRWLKRGLCVVLFLTGARMLWI